MRQRLRHAFGLAILVAGGGSLLAQGIRFEAGSFEAAQARAAHEHKMLMLVVCADWLDVCNIMHEDIFTDPEVGAAFNGKFIAWRLDAAQLDGQLYFAGIRLLSIPEFIFWDAQGRPQYREKKFRDHDEILAMARAALDPGNHLDRLDARYQAGERDPAWLPRYLVEMDAAGHDMTAPSQAYLQKLPLEALLQTPNWIIAGVGVQKISDAAFQYVLANQPAFVAQYGEQVVQDFILRVYRNSLSEAVTAQNGQLLSQCQDVVRALLPPAQAAVVILQDELTYLAAGGHWPEYERKAIALFAIFKDEDPNIYNDVAWALCEHVTNPASLKNAERWAAQSVAYGPAYWNWHTLATLQLKNGDLDAARASAQKALALTEPDTEDAATVQELLAKIEKSR
jgi:Thioredoxin-like